MNFANRAFIDETGARKVRVDETYCIHCGACIDIRDHGARRCTDDTEMVFTDLADGVPIVAVAAPALLVNFAEPQRLLGYLKRCGELSMTYPSAQTSQRGPISNR